MGRPLSGVIRRKDYYTASDASNSIEAFLSAEGVQRVAALAREEGLRVLELHAVEREGQQVVTVTLTGTNDGPVVTSGPGDAAGAATENAAPVTGGTLAATDADAGAALAWSGSAAGLYGSFAIAADNLGQSSWCNLPVRNRD